MSPEGPAPRMAAVLRGLHRALPDTGLTGPGLSRCCRFWAVDVRVPAACRALVDELEWEIAQVDPRKTIQMGSFRINPDGSQSVVEVGSIPAGSCLAAGGLWVGAMGGAELAGAAVAQRGR